MLKKANTARNALPIRSGMAVLLTCIAATVSAHDVQAKFEMTVIRDAAHGAKIVSGDVYEAIRKIESGSVRASDEIFVSNNLCVAYTMTAKFDAAQAACSQAVDLMAEEAALSESTAAVRYHAIALINRGVLRAMSGKGELAREDFETARQLRAGLSAPKRNLAYLARRTAQASID